VYCKLDADLWAAKSSYSMHEYGRIFRDFALDISAGLCYFRVATSQYLARVSYLLGCQ